MEALRRLGLQAFVMQPGNQIELSYYTGVEAGNPSGTLTNIKYVNYNTKVLGGDTFDYSFRLTLTYDLADNLLTVSNVSL